MCEHARAHAHAHAHMFRYTDIIMVWHIVIYAFQKLEMNCIVEQFGQDVLCCSCNFVIMECFLFHSTVFDCNSSTLLKWNPPLPSVEPLFHSFICMLKFI